METDRNYVRPGEAIVPVFARGEFAALFGGALAGVIAAIPMAIVAGLVAWLLVKAPLFDPLVRIASTAFGEGIVHEPVTASVLIVGGALHLLVGMAYGAIFGTIVDRIVGVTPLVAGIVYSLVVFLLTFFYLAPHVAPVLVNEQVSMIGMAFAHLAYGVTLGLLTPLLQRALMGPGYKARRRGRGRDLPPIPLPVVKPATP